MRDAIPCTHSLAAHRDHHQTKSSHLKLNHLTHLHILSDPQNTEYVCLRGLRRKVEKWEPSPEETGQLHIPTDEEKQKLAEDAFFKVEHDHKDEDKLKKAVPVFQQIQVCFGAVRCGNTRSMTTIHHVM